MIGICIFLLHIYISIFKKYLFLAALGLGCGTRDLLLQHMGSFVAVHGLLFSCGAQAPECAGSVVAVRRLSSCGAWAL